MIAIKQLEVAFGMAKAFVKKVKKVPALGGRARAREVRLVGGACRPRRGDHKREMAFGKFSRRWVSASLVGYGGGETRTFFKRVKNRWYACAKVPR